MKGEVLNDFLNAYRDRCEKRNERPIPKAKLKAALEDFMFAELQQSDEAF